MNIVIILSVFHNSRVDFSPSWIIYSTRRFKRAECCWVSKRKVVLHRRPLRRTGWYLNNSNALPLSVSCTCSFRQGKVCTGYVFTMKTFAAFVDRKLLYHYIVYQKRFYKFLSLIVEKKGVLLKIPVSVTHFLPFLYLTINPSIILLIDGNW